MAHVRADPGHHRDGHHLRDAALHLRHPGSDGRHRFRPGGHGPLRDLRGPAERGEVGGDHAREEQDQEPPPQPRRTGRSPSGPSSGAPCSGFSWGCSRAPAPVISTYVSYAMEKKISKHPEKFGTGAIEGVAGSGGGQQCRIERRLVPLFTLGIPANSVIALLLGALHDPRACSPGPHVHHQASRTSSGAPSRACTSATSCCWS